MREQLLIFKNYCIRQQYCLKNMTTMSVFKNVSIDSVADLVYFSPNIEFLVSQLETVCLNPGESTTKLMAFLII